MWGIAGSGHSQFLDVPHRSHAGVEDRVRTNKAMGLANLPSASWEVNRGWMLAANLASDLDAWVRLLALHDIDDLADAEPDTMRFRLYHPPARLADHARRRWLRIDATWPWAQGVHHLLAAAHRPPSRHLTAGHCPDKDQEGDRPTTLRARGTRRSRSDTRRPTPNGPRTIRANRRAGQPPNPADESRRTSTRHPGHHQQPGCLRNLINCHLINYATSSFVTGKDSISS